MINRKVAQAIYDYLKKEIKTLPAFSYNIGREENNELIFRNNQQNLKYYFGEIGNYEYDIYYVMNSTDAIKQFNNFDNIIKSLLKLKYINIDNIKYRIVAIYFNGNPNPENCWISQILDNYDKTNQIYTLNLSLNLERRE